MSEKKDFIRRIVEADRASGRCAEVVTRFPPEPNGFPHIGHAKSISINFGIARDYQGHCNLRMDDTNPTTEDPAYVTALKEAVTWLGFDWGEQVYYTSDYFPKLYDYAVQLIQKGKAYVDSLDEEEIRAYRGTVTEPGRRSRYAQRSIEENLDLFARMKAGEFPDGAHVLRARIDMAAPNMKMRDPLLYRIRHAHHFRAGDAWSIYPMYDFAHCLSDYIEGVSHSLCTLEFENNRDVYDWILEALELAPPRPHQYEFARLNINHTVMSKRKLLELVDGGFVRGWDDPRLPTIAGYRRRGYTPESILAFCDQIGIAKANSVVDVSQLEFAIRDDLNPKAPRVMCVLDPLKITIENYTGSEEIDAPYYPHDVPKTGSRILPFSHEIYIEREDFMEHPPKGYYRLTPDQPVRLKHAYIITCTEVIRDARGTIVEVKARYHPDSKSGSDTSGIKVKSAIQWVEAHTARQIEVRLYDRLFTAEAPQGPEDINPDSLTIIPDAWIEPAAVTEKPDVRFQFERQGYFYADPVDYTDARPVFNRIVSLKDSWGRQKQSARSAARISTPKSIAKPAQIDGEVVPMTADEQARFDRYTRTDGLNSEVANTLARDVRLSALYTAARTRHDHPKALANMVANDVARILKQTDTGALPFGAEEIAELVRMVDAGTLSSKMAKEVFEAMAHGAGRPAEIVAERGWIQISDPDQIQPLLDAVLAAHPEHVARYQAGNTKLLGFFVGQVLKATAGKANPQVVNSLVAKALQS